jgi:hypothetical protein
MVAVSAVLRAGRREKAFAKSGNPWPSQDTRMYPIWKDLSREW